MSRKHPLAEELRKMWPAVITAGMQTARQRDLAQRAALALDASIKMREFIDQYAQHAPECAFLQTTEESGEAVCTCGYYEKMVEIEEMTHE